MNSVILLDLDNTLVHATTNVIHQDFDRLPHPELHIHVRPYVREFLTYLMRSHERFEFGFWTCGTREYAREVVDGLLAYAGAPDWPVRILLSRDDATCVDGTYIKDLRIVKERYQAEDLILLDDNPIHLHFPDNVPHVCLVPAFNVTSADAIHDCFLLRLNCISETNLPAPEEEIAIVHRPQAIRAAQSAVPAIW